MGFGGGSMREIEFRIWSEKDNKYLCYAPLKTLLNTKDRTVKLTQDNITLEQYTGLKDKNGKKIFEGDIIQFQSIKVWYQNEIMLKKMQCKTQKEFDDWYKTLKLPKGIVIETVFDAYDIGQNELTNFYQIISNIHEEAQDV